MVQDPMRKNGNSFQDINDNLIKLLKELPELAQEPIVDNNFIATSFFDALGFNLQERIPGFKTGTEKKLLMRQELMLKMLLMQLLSNLIKNINLI